MIFGTFDIIHKGHLNFFEQAKSIFGKKEIHNSFLIVSLARDKNVLKIKKKLPVNNERKRLSVVKKITLVDKAVLGGVNKYISHIVKEKPDIIALGYDQTAYVDNLKKDLAKLGLKPKIVRLKPHKPHLYKTSIILKK